MLGENRFSLLFPLGSDQGDCLKLDEQVMKDLELDYLIGFLVPGRLMNKLQYESIKKVIVKPSVDERVVKYRLDITGDLLDHQEIFNAFERLVSIVESLSYYKTGRFADEAKRINSCMMAATSRSLILMNESFASTNYEESLYITSDVMRIFRMLGVRVVFATHFHDLARRVEEINGSVSGRSRLISLVSEVNEAVAGDGIKRTYRISPGPPAGKSYARDIAVRYKICFKQLQELLKERGVLACSIIGE